MGSRVRSAVLLSSLCLAGCAAAGGGGGALERASEEAAAAALRAGDAGQAATIWGNLYESRPSAAAATKAGRALRLAGDPRRAVVLLQGAARRYPDDAALLTELARSALAGGYLPEARDAVARAAASPGADWTTWLVYGAYAARAGDHAAAEAHFGRALAIAPGAEQALSARADLALLRADRGDLAGAVAEMRQVAARPGADARVGAMLAALVALQADRTNPRR